jgi:hypothetical protein
LLIKLKYNRDHNCGLIPKIPWDQKLVDCCLGSLCEDFYFFSNFFFCMSELHISQAFHEHQARPIPTPYEPVANSCWKQVLSSFFMYFLMSSYMQPCGWNCPRAEGHGFQKIVCFAHKILVFHFFSLFFWLMVLHDITFNVSATIWMWSFLFFSRSFTSSIVLKCWVKTPSTKIILAHSYLQIWSSNLRLVCSTWFGSDMQKTQKKIEDHLISIHFGVKKFTVKNTPGKKTLTFECYNLLDPMEWRAVIFRGWYLTR